MTVYKPDPIGPKRGYAWYELRPKDVERLVNKDDANLHLLNCLDQGPVRRGEDDDEADVVHHEQRGLVTCGALKGKVPFRTTDPERVTCVDCLEKLAPAIGAAVKAVGYEEATRTIEPSYVHLNILTSEGAASACKLTPDDAWKGTNEEEEVTCPTCRLTFDISTWHDPEENKPPRNGDPIRAFFSGCHIDTVVAAPGGWKSPFQDGVEYPAEALRKWREPLEWELPVHFRDGRLTLCRVNGLDTDEPEDVTCGECLLMGRLRAKTKTEREVDRLFEHWAQADPETIEKVSKIVEKHALRQLTEWCIMPDVFKVDGDGEYEEKPDMVDHPPHYGGDTTYEAIKVIEAWGLDSSFCLGNTIKYIVRAGKKGDRLEDLKKSRWYLNREIERLEKEKDGKEPAT